MVKTDDDDDDDDGHEWHVVAARMVECKRTKTGLSFYSLGKKLRVASPAADHGR